MASTYSPKLRFELIGAGEQAGLWGTTTNKNVGQLIEQAIAGVTTVELDGVSGNYTLTALDGAPDQSRSAVIKCAYSAVPASGSVNVIVPTQTKLYVFRNDCGQTIYVKTSAQTGGVEILDGESTLVFCDGTDAIPGIETAAVGTLTVSGGGTGSTTFGSGGFVKSSGGTAALTAATAVALGSEVSGTLPVANGGTGVTSFTSGRLVIGNGSSPLAVLSGSINGQVPVWNSSTSAWEAGAGGTVTSVGVSGGSTGFSFSSSPITSSGTMTMSVSNSSTVRSSIGLGTIATQNSNNVSISGGSITGVSLSASDISSGTLAAGNGGTGLSSTGNTGNLLTSNGSSWVSTNPVGTTISFHYGGTSSTTFTFPLNSAGTWQLIADFRAGVDDSGQYDFTTSVAVTVLGNTATPSIRFKRSGGSGYGRTVYGTNISSLTFTVSSPGNTTISVGAITNPQPSLMIAGSFGLIITCVKIT